jgi:hypothetical protein
VKIAAWRFPVAERQERFAGGKENLALVLACGLDGESLGRFRIVESLLLVAQLGKDLRQPSIDQRVVRLGFGNLLQQVSRFLVTTQAEQRVRERELHFWVVRSERQCSSIFFLRIGKTHFLPEGFGTSQVGHARRSQYLLSDIHFAHCLTRAVKLQVRHC